MMTIIQPCLADPDPEAWEVWYRDRFDRECPPNCEVRGRGLVGGLKELWARHLFENVWPDGSEGFSDFLLDFGNKRNHVEGPWEGAVRLRSWLFGNEEQTANGYVAEADAGLLKKIAEAHAVLIQIRRTSEPILIAAIESSDRQVFEKRLADFSKRRD